VARSPRPWPAARRPYQCLPARFVFAAAVRGVSVHPDPLSHEPIVNDDDFTRAQQQLTRRARVKDTPHKPHPTRHPYVFKSLLYCGTCNRKMQGQHSHDVAYYRCRYPQEYALANRVDHPKNVIMREDTLITPLDTWIARELAPQRRDHTIATIAQQSGAGLPAAPTHAVYDNLVATYHAKIARYRAALDAGADPVRTCKPRQGPVSAAWAWLVSRP
jgi:site-specific DNA recombinase